MSFLSLLTHYSAMFYAYGAFEDWRLDTAMALTSCVVWTTVHAAQVTFGRVPLPGRLLPLSLLFLFASVLSTSIYGMQIIAGEGGTGLLSSLPLSDIMAAISVPNAIAAIYLAHHARSSRAREQQLRLPLPVSTFVRIPATRIRPELCYASETCVICLDGPPSRALLPCRHLCMCDTCGSMQQLCPVCRRQVEEVAVAEEVKGEGQNPRRDSNPEPAA